MKKKERKRNHRRFLLFSISASWLIFLCTVCVCVCVQIPPILIFREHVPACATVSTSPGPSSSLLTAGYHWWKSLTSGNVPVLTGLGRTGASFQKSLLPVSLSSSLLAPPPYLHPHLHPPKCCSFKPWSELGAYWNTSLWLSLHFKVDFHPGAGFEGGKERVRPCLQSVYHKVMTCWKAVGRTKRSNRWMRVFVHQEATWKGLEIQNK